jgi:hypothetical protein
MQTCNLAGVGSRQVDELFFPARQFQVGSLMSPLVQYLLKSLFSVSVTADAWGGGGISEMLDVCNGVLKT